MCWPFAHQRGIRRPLPPFTLHTCNRGSNLLYSCPIKVTPQQLSQPLGSGARVFEIPGVFDDCMKVVEALSESYNVALLNSKNAWRILGQESYSYEIAQDLEYDLSNTVVVLPIGNAGNITAVMSGFLKFYETGIIGSLPEVWSYQTRTCQSCLPVLSGTRCRQTQIRTGYRQIQRSPGGHDRQPGFNAWVIHLVKYYNESAGHRKVFFVDVSEQNIMDCELAANRNGHTACTTGGESLAGLLSTAKERGILDEQDIAMCSIPLPTRLNLPDFKKCILHSSFHRITIFLLTRI